MSTSFENPYHARQDSSQSSPTLLPQVIAKGSENNGQSTNTGSILQVPSLTSTNNFINFCVDSTLTNGKPSQQSTCNPAPMGHIPSRQNIPSTRIRGPRNGDVFLENTSISVTLATNNFATGNAVNPDTNYLAAPQQLDSNGLVLGHYHLIVDALESFGQASPTDPTMPIFSAELGTPTRSLSTTISLSVGFYRISAIAHAANHQPVVPPIDQHGSLNDVVYIIVQPNPKSKRSDHQEALQDHKSAFAEDYISTSNYSRNGMTKRQDPSTSLTLDPSVISSGFSQDGINGSAGGAFTPSLTSTNNFINYCATLLAVPLTNGTQQTTDSCNPIPMGALPSSQNMPSVKFTNPAFNDTIKQDTPFLVSLNVTNFVSSKSTNTQVNTFSAPQQLVSAGRIIGHTLVVIEEYSPDTITSPQIFSFTSTVDSSGTSSSGIFTVNVTGGLPIGFYRLSSIVSTANHQPVIMPFHDHGAIDDAIFFSVTENGGGPPPLPTLSTATTTATSTPTTSPASSAAPSTNTISAADKNASHNTRSMGGAIAGAVIGAVLLCGIALAVLFLWRRRKARARREKAEVEIDDARIDVTPFEGWHGGNPSMHQIHTPASGSNSVFPPSEQDSSHGASLVSLSKVQLVSPSNMRKSALQSTNMSSDGKWSERRRSTVSRTSIAPSYHTNAP